MTEAALFSPDLNAQTQAQQALDELDDAARLASESLNQNAAAGTASADAPDDALESEEERAARNAERVKRFVQRAARQRNAGREEMERTYTGVMVVEREVKVFDPNLASSVVRFLALTDKTMYLLGRIGPQYMTAAQIDKVREQVLAKVEEYTKEAHQALSAARELSSKNREANFMWIEPHYVSAMLDQKFQVKTRYVLPLVDAVSHWDEAIRLMCEMEFNACATENQISEIRLRERRLFSAINRFCAQVIMGMSRRSQADISSSRPRAEASNQEGASQD